MEAIYEKIWPRLYGISIWELWTENMFQVRKPLLNTDDRMLASNGTYPEIVNMAEGSTLLIINRIMI